MPKSTPPPTLRPADLSAEHMRAAIPKLARRIEELKAVDVNTIQDRSEPRFSSLEQKIDDTLVDTFGADTLEYKRYQSINLDTASVNYLHPTPLHEIREGYQRGIGRAVSSLQTIVDLFEEKLRDSGESPRGRAVRAFADLDLHSEIARAVSTLFRDGHYANAVEDACKVLDALVKMRSGRFDRSGTELMQEVFSAKNPVLKFNNLQTDTDRSEQQGMMFLFAGAMLALRNPRAHELIKDDPEQALEYIAFLSMLAKSLDRATK
jgi:uncharacterized protein (TIGR02391 family)